MNDVTDIALMQQVAKGDEQALHILIDRYRECLYRLAYSLLGDSMAEDAVQETFIQMWTYAHRYNPHHSLSTWLYTICCHKCYDELRHRRRRRKAVEKMPEIAIEEKDLESKELLALLHWATALLPPKQQIVYLLREIEGLSTEQTMAVTQMTSDQVKANLWSARNAVKEKLKQYGI